MTPTCFVRPAARDWRHTHTSLHKLDLHESPHLDIPYDAFSLTSERFFSSPHANQTRVVMFNVRCSFSDAKHACSVRALKSVNHSSQLCFDKHRMASGFPASRLPGFPASGFGFPEVSRKMKKSAFPEVCRKSEKVDFRKLAQYRMDFQKLAAK